MQDVPNAYENSWSSQAIPVTPPPTPPPAPPPPRLEADERGPRRDRRWQPSPFRDDATRLLSAAAHLDAAFAGDSIREFLSDPLRAVAPSPGVNSAAVLREAVAATTRRRWRDGTLAGLLVVFALSNLPLFALWLVTAAVANAVGPRRRRIDGVLRPRMSTRAFWVTAGLAIITLTVGGAAFLTGVLALVGGGILLGGSTAAAPVALTVLLLPVLVGLLGGAVLVVDRVQVWSLITRTFRRGAFSVDGTERMRTMGSGGLLGPTVVRFTGGRRSQRSRLSGGQAIRRSRQAATDVADHDPPACGGGRPSKQQRRRSGSTTGALLRAHRPVRPHRRGASGAPCFISVAVAEQSAR